MQYLITCQMLHWHVTLSFAAVMARAVCMHQHALDKAVISAVRRGETSDLVPLIHEGCNLSYVDSRWGKSALMFAVERGDKQQVEILLSEGAPVNMSHWPAYMDPTKQDDAVFKGITCLMMAVLKGHVDLLETLLQRGAVFGMLEKSTTVLHMAAYAGQAEMVERLLSLGMCPDVQDDGGNSPLSLSVNKGQSAVLRFWCRNFLKNFWSDTWHHNEHLATVRVLLRHGARVNVMNSFMLNTVAVYLLDSVCRQNTFPTDKCSYKIASVRLLQGAGEHVPEGIHCSLHGNIHANVHPPLVVKDPKPLSLLSLSRYYVRQHLLNVHHGRNLFTTVPKLCIPRELKSFLLYDVDIPLGNV